MKKKNKNKKKRVVIGVVTCRKNGDREKSCRKTWAKGFKKNNLVVVVYVTAKKGLKSLYEFDHKKQILYCNCPDGYNALPQKTRIFCQWALDTYCFDYLFKCDDDTYIFMKNFLKFINLELKDQDYLGTPVKPFYASGGGGYFLSEKSAKIIAKETDFDFGAEDAMVGKVLKENKIKFHKDKRFKAWRRYWISDTGNNNGRIIPKRDVMKNFITAHLLRLPAKKMYEFHKVARGL